MDFDIADETIEDETPQFAPSVVKPKAALNSVNQPRENLFNRGVSAR